jgi:hypothetical protein
MMKSALINTVCLNPNAPDGLHTKLPASIICHFRAELMAGTWWGIGH